MKSHRIIDSLFEANAYSTLVDLVQEIIGLVTDSSGGHKRDLRRLLGKLRKVEMPDPEVMLALRGDMMNPGLEDEHKANLVGSLKDFIQDYTYTQEECYDDRSWDESMAARFPVLDDALTLLYSCDQLTDYVYARAYRSVAAWDDFEGFTSVSRPHLEDEHEPFD